MTLLRDTATKRPLQHVVGSRVVAEGYFVTTTAGAILSQAFPSGYSAERTATGTYVLTVPDAALNLAIPGIVSAHSMHTVRVTAAANSRVTIKTATFGVTVDQGPPVTVTPAYTVADISGLIITVLFLSTE